MTANDKNRWFLMLPDEPVSPDLASVSEGIYFHMWRTRQEPWTALTDGDTVYLVDKTTRRIQWELRARHLRRVQYRSMDEAFTAIRESFGLFPEDLNDYILDRPTEGFLLGWATEVIAPVDAVLPQAVDFGMLGARHGYLAWSRLPKAVAASLHLPPPGRPPIAEPASWMTGDSVLVAPQIILGRYIPVAVRRAVWRSDGGRCKKCGTAEPPIHFDHIWPVVKGGGNGIDNIQLLCRRHNLEKAARIVAEARRPVGVDLVDSLARDLRISAPRDNLADVVDAAVAAGRVEDAAGALLAELDLMSKPLSLLPAIDRLGHDLPVALLLRARLAELITTEHPGAARELAVPLLDCPDPSVRGTASLAVAEATPELALDRRQDLYTLATLADDQWVSGFAHLYLSELAQDPEDVRGHLEQAAASNDPTPRSRAAFLLGQLAEDEDEARAWFRRALITREPELFAECAAELALLADGYQACAYARWALRSDDVAVAAVAHLVLGLNDPDDDRWCHLEQASKSPDAALRDEALAALARLAR